MIYPARLAVLTAAVTVPLTLLIALSFPAFWTAGLALIALLIALCTADAFSGAGLSNSDVQCEGPRTASVGETFAVIVRARYSGRAPSAAQSALGIEGPVSAPFGWSAQAITGVAGAEAAIMLKAKRRGTARIDAVWIRWRSPLGLVCQGRPAVEYTQFDTRR